MYSHPQQGNRSTQTEPQPPAAPPMCVPLQMVDDDGKRRYCYHGGKCRCENCELVRQQQMDELDRNLDAFIPSSRLKLVPAIRQVKRKPYAVQANYTSPEYGLTLLKHHIMLLKDNPVYYLPDNYYYKDFWKLPGPQEKGTQTEVRLGAYGIDGCPCPDKAVCWDI